MKKIYFAGPDVFEPDAKARGRDYVSQARAQGFVGLFPLDKEIDFSQPNPDIAIYHGNVKMLDAADYVLANLNPFRGHEPDSGTVWEVAYAIAKGKVVIAYMENTSPMLDKLRQQGSAHQHEHGYVDNDGKTIENFGNPLNLMLQHSVTQVVQGGVAQALQALLQYEQDTSTSH